MEKRYFGYIRVSTAKQGEKGVSLQEQKDAISTYGARYGLQIIQWYEERESAAKRGRPIFTQMLRQLQRNEAQGVIIHKIDRGARNLKDWADLGDLIDSGVEVHFANESLDLHTRGGRLSADIQAVVAADYIRNLREETRKGFYGRLKQGLYPLPAPLGYLDRGKGKPKEVDAATAPLISKAFELYATADYPLHRLRAEMSRIGLRNRQGKELSLTGLSTILNNPFYVGLIRIRRTGELFEGNQPPLVRKATFDRVQAILRGKTVNRLVRHDFTFRRLVRCDSCGRSLIGEHQKGHVYYRCQTQKCPTKTIREEMIDTAVKEMMSRLVLDTKEIQHVESWVANTRLQRESLLENELQGCKLQLDGARERLRRLTDALIDGLIEKGLFEDRKSALLQREKEIQEKISELQTGTTDCLVRVERFLELVKNAPFTYQNANLEEKRDLVKELTSNLSVNAKNVYLMPKPSVQLLVNRPKPLHGAPYRGIPRTWNRVLQQLLDHFKNQIAQVPR